MARRKAFKNLLKILVAGLLGLVAGYGLGYMRLPMLDKGSSFWVGFGACAALALYIVIAVTVWRGRSRPARSERGRGGSLSLFWIIVSGCLVLVAVGGAWMLYNSKSRLENDLIAKDRRIAEMESMVAAIRTEKQVIVMAQVLELVDLELKENGNGLLSEGTIARVAALSKSLQPFRYIDGDSLAAKPLSPERGQLLQQLAHMGIDSASFARLKATATFAKADLKAADLAGTDLSGANLHGANLRDADLRKANLDGADFRTADFWGANMDSATAVGANFNRAEMSWAEMNAADLRKAELNAATMHSAKLRHADLREATLRWTKSPNALCNGADFTDADMLRIVFTKANLTGANLRRTNLLLATLDEAHFAEAALDSARVDKDWTDKLLSWQLTGSEAIAADYVVIPDTTNKYPGSVFMLQKVVR